MKIATIIESLPTFTQLGVLYPILGSLNSSAINTASREVARELKALDAGNRAIGSAAIAIDKYNEYMNELRQKELNDANTVEQGFEDETARPDRLTMLLTMRAPLLGVFNTALSKLPNSENGADFSFEESLARQMAREYSLEQRASDEIDKGLIESGAVTAEELAATDKAAFEADQNFKKEFRFLILDKLREREPFDTDLEDADEAFQKLGYDFQERMLRRVLPKLEEAKRQQIGRRGFDPDASTNIILIGLAINEIKKFIGPSEADEKLAKLQAALAS